MGCPCCLKPRGVDLGGAEETLLLADLDLLFVEETAELLQKLVLPGLLGLGELIQLTLQLRDAGFEV